MAGVTQYTSDKADVICERLAMGESMRSICRDDSMPAMSTVFKWLREVEEFSEQYARAKEESADALFEDLLEIADDGTNDWMERNSSDGSSLGWAINGEHIQRSRLRIDARKWAMSKMKPKKYGEKIQVGGDTDNPLTLLVREISGNTLRPKDDNQ